MEEEKEIDSKEVSDALHMLLHCSLKDTEYETQKQQFEIVNAYIKQLEKENEEWQRAYQEEKDKQFELLRENKQLEEERDNYKGCFIVSTENSIPKSKVKEILDKNCITFFEGDTDFPDDASRIIAKKYIKAEVLQELLREEQGTK